MSASPFFCAAPFAEQVRDSPLQPQSDTDPERSGEQREGGEIDTDAGQREHHGQSDQGSLDQLAEEHPRAGARRTDR